MKPAALVKDYISSLDIHPLAIIAGAGGSGALIVRTLPPGLTPFDILWFSRELHADLVMANCPAGPEDRPAALLRDDIVNTAAALGAPFRTTHEIEADAEKAVAGIIGQIETWRQNGGLAKVNRDYKTYRQTQMARGQKAVPYSTHLASFARSLVVLAAQNSAPR